MMSGMIMEHIVEEHQKELDVLKRDIEFLLTLVPDWSKKIEAGLDLTMYGTGSFEGDKKIVRRVKAIQKKIK